MKDGVTGEVLEVSISAEGHKLRTLSPLVDGFYHFSDREPRLMSSD